jgi:hypothetical protein
MNLSTTTRKIHTLHQGGVKVTDPVTLAESIIWCPMPRHNPKDAIKDAIGLLEEMKGNQAK